MSTIVVMSSEHWTSAGAARDLLEEIRDAGWARAQLVYRADQPAGVLAARWWSAQGGPARPASPAQLVETVRGPADLLVVLVRNLDPEACEVLDIAERAAVPALLRWHGPYPFLNDEHATTTARTGRRPDASPSSRIRPRRPGRAA